MTRAALSAATAVLLTLVGCGSANEADDRARPGLDGSDLDPVALGFLAQHHQVPVNGEVELGRWVESLAAARQGWSPVVADPRALDVMEFVVGRGPDSESVVSALVRGEGREASALFTMDPAGARTRLLRSILARGGHDPAVASPDDLRRELAAIREVARPFDGAGTRRREGTHSFQLAAALADLSGPALVTTASILWVEPPVDLASPSLGRSGLVTVPDPWLLAALVWADHDGVQVDCLSLFSETGRVLESIPRTGDGEVWLRLFRPSRGSDASGLQRGIQALDRIGAKQSEPTNLDEEVVWWDAGLPREFERRVRSVIGDVVSDRFAPPEHYDVAIWDPPRELYAVMRSMGLINLRRVLRPGGVLVTPLRLDDPVVQVLGWTEAGSATVGDVQWLAYRRVPSSP